MPEVLYYDKLNQYLMHKNGNYLYKVPYRGGWAVLKHYYGDRTLFQYIKKTISNLTFNNKTSFMPKHRRRKELDCLNLWRNAGFRVFDTYDDMVVEGLPMNGYTLFEYLENLRFQPYFSDKTIPLDERLDMWRRFLPVWHRRHALAIKLREPRFVHENGDLDHIMIMEDGIFLFFDLEMFFRSRRRVREFVTREILTYLKSLCKAVGREHWDTFLKETINYYPDRSLLAKTYDYAFCHPNLVLRAARYFDYNFKPRAKQLHSKYNIALKLRELMNAS